MVNEIRCVDLFVRVNHNPQADGLFDGQRHV